MLEAELEDTPLALHQCNRVGEFGRREACTCWEVMKEVRVEVKGVGDVVFQNIDEIDPDFLTDRELDRIFPMVVVKGNSIHEVEIICAVEVDVVTAHHHHHFAIDRGPASLRIDDEGSVQSLGDVLRKR